MKKLTLLKQKFSCFLLTVMLLAPMAVSARTIYLDCSSVNYFVDGALVSMWTWGGSSADAWVAFSYSGTTNYYVAEIADDRTGGKIVRNNSSVTAPSWDNVWNQTGDISIPNDKNVLKLTDWNGNYSWSAPTATSVTLNKNTLNLTVGEESTLTATVAPVYTYDKTIEWTTNSSTVATVSNGKVTAKAAGTATITAKTSNGKTATCTVTVASGDILSTAVTISETTAKLKKNGTLTLTAEANGTNKAVTWGTSDATVASVNGGVVTAKKKGTATITATAADGSGAKATCAVTVLETYTFTINLYDRKSWAHAYQYIFESLDQNSASYPGTEVSSTTVDGLKWWKYTFTNIDENANFILSNESTANPDGYKSKNLSVSENHTTGYYYLDDSGNLQPFKHVTGVSLNKSATTIKVNKTENLVATIAPSNATVTDKTWTTSDDKVATVIGGTVTAKGAGTATITVTTKDGSKTATCVVTVPSTAVTISETAITLLPTTTKQLTASANGPEATVVWSSSNSDVAEVSNTGLVTAKAPGTATITAKASDDNTVSKTCTVKVEAVFTVGETLYLDVNVWAVDNARFTAKFSNSITLAEQSVNMTQVCTGGNLYEVTIPSGLWTDVTFCRVEPNGENIWNNTGKLTPNSGKVCTINGWDSSPSWGTAIPVATVTLDDIKVTNLMVDWTYRLNATICPANATSQTITWSSSNAAIATVSSDGVITAVAPGDVTITATVGGKTATCEVQVVKGIVLVNSVTLDQSSLELTVAQTHKLTATVLPEDATDKTITWTSSDPTIASVSSDGIVTALKFGNVTITAKNESSTRSATCTVNVKEDPVVIYFYKPSNLEWSVVKTYLWSGSVNLLGAYPGTEMEQLADTIYRITLPMKPTGANDGIIFTDGTDAHKITAAKTETGFEVFDPEKTYFDAATNKWYSLICDIPSLQRTIKPTVFDVKRNATCTLAIEPSCEGTYTYNWAFSSADLRSRLSATNIQQPVFDATGLAEGTYRLTLILSYAIYPQQSCTSIQYVDVNVTYQDYHAKHPFKLGDEEWYWKKMDLHLVEGGDDYYTCEGRSGGPDCGANVHTSEANAGYIDAADIIGHERVAKDDMIQFIYTPKTNTLEVKQWAHVSTLASSQIGTETLQLNGKIEYGNDITSYGFYLTKGNSVDTTAAAIADGKTVKIEIEGTCNGNFSRELSGIKNGDYQFSAYAVNHDGTVDFGSNISVKMQTYYIAGNGTTAGGGAWVCGLDWDTQGCPFDYATNSVTYKHLPTGEYKFKITTGSWEQSWGYAEGKIVTPTNLGVYGDGNNNDGIVVFNLGGVHDVTITFDPTTEIITITHSEISGYRLKSELRDGTVLYSNIAQADDEIMSVYVHKSDGTLSLEGNIGTGEGGENGDFEILEANISKAALSEDMVIVAPIQIDGSNVSVGTLSKYEGAFYIRTDKAEGGWNNYKQAGNQFTYFEPHSYYPNETYNHYWVKWIESPENDRPNVSGRVANDYNYEITPELTYTENNGVLPQSANVRFGYNDKTNTLEREFLAGSTSNSQFLTLTGAEIYQDEQEGSAVLGTKEFTDLSNWVYEIDLWAAPGANVQVHRRYNNEDKCLTGETNVVLLGDGSTDNFGGVVQNYQMRVLYDYKMNRVVASWVIDRDMPNVGLDLTIDANVLFVRNGNAPVCNLNLTGSGKINDINRIYFAMELHKDTVVTKKQNMFWFSLPYDCKVSDIFGIEGFNEKWGILYYDGEERGDRGFRTDIKTFWKFVDQDSVLKKNQGYVLTLGLETGDFKSVTIDGKDRSLLRLYFPSSEDANTLAPATNLKTVVPSHACNVVTPTGDSRAAYDSHWNIIGIPSYEDITMGSQPTYNSEYAMEAAPKFLYKWNSSTDTYSCVDGYTNMTYQHFYSYMVQFAGTIDWAQYTQSDVEGGGAQAAPRKTAAQKTQYRYKVTVADKDNVYTDQAFVTRTEDGTTDYVINRDLSKMMNANNVNIYTLSVDEADESYADGDILAANDLPLETERVALGLIVPKAGVYIIALEGEPYSTNARLYDAQTGEYTDLSRGSYEFETEYTGTIEGRFELRFAANSPTVELENVTESYMVTTHDGRVVIEGLTDGTQVYLFDATGRLVASEKASAYTELTAPVSGVYLLQIGNNYEKVMVR